MKESEVQAVEMSQRILKAADKLFLEQGFASTSTVQVARLAGCNQALVHYYYRSKELLFQAVFESKIRMFSEVFFAIDDMGGSFLERLTRRIEAHFDLLAANPLLPRLIVTEVSSNPRRLREMRDKAGHIAGEIFGVLESDLQRAIERGEVREISVLDLFLNILAVNAAVFLVVPAVSVTMAMSDEQQARLMAHRRIENVKTIINSLRP